MSAPAEAEGAPEFSVRAPGFREAARVWLKIGLINFGGPAGQIALMHRVLVEEKHWIDEARFLHALNYCMLLPGPEAQQLATYVGWLLHGVRGGVVAGTLFVIPGFVVLVALSAAYLEFGHLPLVEGLFFGLKAAVLALVAEALIRVARRALKGPLMVAVAVAAFVAIAFFKIPFPLIVFGAALIGVSFSARARPTLEGVVSDNGNGAAFSAAARAVLLWGAVWLAPVAAMAALLGRQNVFTQEALFFSKVAVVTFGGAYAVLSYVAQQAVETYHWLRPGRDADRAGSRGDDARAADPGSGVRRLPRRRTRRDGSRSARRRDPWRARDDMGDVRAVASSSSSPALRSSSGFAQIPTSPARLRR